jgi:hypothetical protein
MDEEEYIQFETEHGSIALLKVILGGLAKTLSDKGLLSQEEFEENVKQFIDAY